METEYDIEREAVGIVSREKIQWETGVAFITEKVAFQMRNLIRQLRKNYWGVFDTPTDEQTGRKKIWIPLTESFVESAVKNIELGTKDINFRAKKRTAYGLSKVIRNIVKNELDAIFFGDILRQITRTMAIDGTCVIYTGEEMTDEKRKKLDIRVVDLLNFYIDPTAKSIQETEAVIERIIVTLDEFKNLARDNQWVNEDKVKGARNVSKYDGEFKSVNIGESGETLMVELYKRTGKMPKAIITGKEDNKKEYIEGEIICSYVNGSGWLFHGAEDRKEKPKPYEEVWYTRVPNRWYGKGIAEKVMMLQIWLNTIKNIDITRSYVAALGLFKIREGSGITPAMMTRLSANGALIVKDQGDVEQMVIQEAHQGVVMNENSIQNWAERVTSAFEVVTGETLPASTTATAIAQQSRTSNSSFVLVKEGIGIFLQRWMKRHALPVIMKSMRKEDIVLYTGEPQDLRDLDSSVANMLVYEELKRMNEAGLFIDPMEVERERERILQTMGVLGKDRYVQISEEIDYSDYDVQVYITNEEIDKNSTVSNLISLLTAVPEYKEQITSQVFDLLGLDILKQAQPTPQTPQPIQQQPQPIMQ